MKAPLLTGVMLSLLLLIAWGSWRLMGVEGVQAHPEQSPTSALQGEEAPDPTSVSSALPPERIERTVRESSPPEPVPEAPDRELTGELALEPSPELVAKLRVPLSEGQLEVLVLGGVEPMPAARVIVHSKREAALQDDHLAVGAGGLEVVTDENGLALVRGLEAGSYSVRVQVPAFPIQEVRAQVGKSGAKRTLVVFGSASVIGTVYNDAGRPVRDATVKVSTHFQGPMGSAFSVTVNTDEHGRYAITGLNAADMTDKPVSTYWASCHSGPVPEQFTFDLALGETKRVDFGAVPGRVLLSGTVLDTEGRAVEHAPGFTLRRADGMPLRVEADADGRFSSRVTPGAYELHFRLNEISTDVERFEIGAEGLKRDVLLPGCRLIVDLEYVGDWHDKDGALVGVQAWLRSQTGGKDQILRNLTKSKKAVFGLAAGRYSLTTWPTPMVVTPVEINVVQGQAELRVQAQVTDP